MAELHRLRQAPPPFDTHATRGELADVFARHIAYLLQKAIETCGVASIAVSGGSTPKLLFRTLARQIVDWQHVTITLVDDRWVPETSERSNVKLVRENLLSGPASAASFVALTTTDPTPEKGLEAVMNRVARLPQPFDVVILGIGHGWSHGLVVSER